MTRKKMLRMFSFSILILAALTVAISANAITCSKANEVCLTVASIANFNGAVVGDTVSFPGGRTYKNPKQYATTPWIRKYDDKNIQSISVYFYPTVSSNTPIEGCEILVLPSSSAAISKTYHVKLTKDADDGTYSCKLLT